MDQFVEDQMGAIHESNKGDARADLNELFAHVGHGREAFIAAYKRHLAKKRGE